MTGTAQHEKGFSLTNILFIAQFRPFVNFTSSHARRVLTSASISVMISQPSMERRIRKVFTPHATLHVAPTWFSKPFGSREVCSDGLMAILTNSKNTFRFRTKSIRTFLGAKFPTAIFFSRRWHEVSRGTSKTFLCRSFNHLKSIAWFVRNFVIGFKALHL